MKEHNRNSSLVWRKQQLLKEKWTQSTLKTQSNLAPTATALVKTAATGTISNLHTPKAPSLLRFTLVAPHPGEVFILVASLYLATTSLLGYSFVAPSSGFSWFITHAPYPPLLDRHSPLCFCGYPEEMFFGGFISVTMPIASHLHF